MIKKLTLHGTDGYQILNDKGRGVFISHEVGARGGDPYDLIKVSHIYISKSKTGRPGKIEYGRRDVTAYDAKKGSKYGRVTQHLLFPSEIMGEVIETITLMKSQITGIEEKFKPARTVSKEMAEHDDAVAAVEAARKAGVGL